MTKEKYGYVRLLCCYGILLTEMWDHQNSVLHNTKLEASHAMHDAEINDAITKLYKKVNTYSAED